jgi:hypothetical protein
VGGKGEGEREGEEEGGEEGEGDWELERGTVWERGIRAGRRRRKSLKSCYIICPCVLFVGSL